MAPLILPINIKCVALNFQELSDKNLLMLSDSYLEDSEETINAFKKMLGFPIEQLAIIHKCNANVLVFAYYQNLSDEYFRGRVLDVWDKLSRNGITDDLKYIKIFNNEEAINYLAECVVGIHSVVVGDTQVFAQIHDSLQNAFRMQNYNPTFKILAGWLNNILNEVKAKTALMKGNVSLERIAACIAAKEINKDEKLCILGLGKSGQLLTKIFSEELKYNLTVSDIDKTIVGNTQKTYSTNIVDFYDYQTISQSSGLILAITPNEETKKYCQKLAELLNENRGLKFLIDMGSPSILNWEECLNKKTFTIKDLSQESKKIVEGRLAEINKTREIINKLYNTFIGVLQKEINDINLKKQKTQTIFKLSQEQTRLFLIRNNAYKAIRKFLDSLDFIEINTPYIVGISTDPPRVDKGGTIDVAWPDGNGAFLRQSNQIYKQLVVASGLAKIFEIGPFWRHETNETFRHLQETIGIDVEYKNPNNLSDIFELAYSIINQTAKCLSEIPGVNINNIELPKFSDIPILNYADAIKKLNSKGYSISYGEDLGLMGEAKIGQIIKRETNSDIVIIQKYPDTIKKFYTKKIEDGLTETFDIIFSGWELVSGAIRETDRKKIERSMLLSGVDPGNYDFYLSALDGAEPHGGFGLGFDRLIAKLLNLEMVHDAVVFPRTYNKLIP